MTLADWMEESRDRFRTLPPGEAARESAVALVNGAARRTIDGVLGDSVWDRDWDILVVADAARVDLAREVIPQYEALPDSADSRWSEASCSLDWIDRVFDDKRARDAGYVTANPFSGHEVEGTMSVDLREGTDVGYLDEVWRDGWQEARGVETVPPETVTDRAIWAWRRRDQLDIDRLIVHYMQPHQPFYARSAWTESETNLANLMEPGREAGFCVWEETRQGRFDREEVWDAYTSNFEWVLDDVTERLLQNADAQVAMTADHGNGMGEWGMWGHPPGAVTPQIRKVPWVPVQAVDHQTVTGTAPPTDDEVAVEDRLGALGYV